MKRYPLLIFSIISLLPLAFLIYGYFNQDQFLASQQIVRNMIEPYGKLAWVAFIVFQILQVVLTPVSHYSVGLAGGFIFGPRLGLVLNLVGRIIGHIVAFAIARYGARPILQRFVPESALTKYDRYVGGSGFILFLAYWLPFFPDDELSYIAGASKMSWKRFLLANVLGQVGGAVTLAYAGAGVLQDPLAYILIGGSFVLGCISFWVLRRKMRQKVFISQV